MTREAGWRIETDAHDYFMGQKKRLEIADRRPVIRDASDLVGPGIGASAVRITDYDDILATFDGYYSSAPGALSAPNTTESFVGIVISDSAMGGVQKFTGLTSRIEYTRVFTRSVTDPESLGWGEWEGARIPATASGYDHTATVAVPGVVSYLKPPQFPQVRGDASVYEFLDAGIRVKKQGVYTGHIQVGDYTGDVTGDVYVHIPDGMSLRMLGQLNSALGPTVNIPFTAVATDANQGFSVSFVLNASFTSTRDVWWRFACTRVGDAI